jgi:hypothetical protein
MADAGPTPTTGDSPSTTVIDSSPSCTTAIPGEHGHVPADACNAYYSFNPSFQGNVAFAVLFGLTLITHVIQAFVYKKVSSPSRPPKKKKKKKKVDLFTFRIAIHMGINNGGTVGVRFIYLEITRCP